MWAAAVTETCLVSSNVWFTVALPDVWSSLKKYLPYLFNNVFKSRTSENSDFLSCLRRHCPSHSGSPNVPVLTFKSTKSTTVRKVIEYSKKKYTKLLAFFRLNRLTHLYPPWLVDSDVREEERPCIRTEGIFIMSKINGWKLKCG